MLTDINQRICRLRNERHAVILAHNYQCAEVQDIADYDMRDAKLAVFGRHSGYTTN